MKAVPLVFATAALAAYWALALLVLSDAWKDEPEW